MLMSRCEESTYVRATKITRFGEILIFFLTILTNILGFKVC